MTPLVITGLPEWRVGGTYVLAERVARGLGALGYDAPILLTETSTVRVSSETAPPAQRPTDIEFDHLPAGFHDSWGQRWNALIRYLEERAPCVYLMGMDWRNNVVASRLSNRVRLVGYVHADYELEYEQAGRLGHYWDAIVAVSDVLEFNLAQRFPHLVPRLTTIRNGVPSLTARPPRMGDRPLRIVYSGELRATQKRIEDLIAVAHRLDQLGASFELTFIGDGPLRAQLEADTAALAGRHRVRFLGTIPSAQVLDELAHHDVFLMTSEFEGLSLALLEAMSRGCVPVVSDLVTQSFLVRDGVNGYAVPVGDIAGFAERLTALATHRELVDRLGAAAFRTIVEEGYREEDMVRSYAALFEQLEDMHAGDRPFVRPRGDLVPPPEEVDGLGILPGDYALDLASVNATPLWPDSPVPGPSLERSGRPRSALPPSNSDAPLSEHKVIVSSPLGYVSGVDVFASQLVGQLRRRGIEAKVLGGEAVDMPGHLGLAHEIPIEPLPGTHLPWLERWRATIDYLETQSPCFYLPSYDYDTATIVPMLPDGVKVVTVAHSDDPLYYDLVMRIGRASNVIAGVSQAILTQIATLAPDLAPRLALTPYGIGLPAPADRGLHSGSPLRLVYTGRLISYQKRVLDLIAIARELGTRGIPFELTIVGDGDELDTLFDQGRRLLLARQLRILRTLPHEEVPDVLRDSDVLLMPSSFEGQPLAVLEAMAHGVVPIVSNVRSGVPELIVDGENGLLAPVGNTQRFADHVCDLHHDRARLQRMSQAAQRTIHAGGHSVEDMTERYIALFEHAIESRFVRPPGAFAPPEHLMREVRRRARITRAVRRRLRPLRAAWRRLR